MAPEMSAQVAEQLDEVAAELINAYRRAGVFAVVVRQFDCEGLNDNVRSIHQQLGADVVSTFLRAAADKLFEGPATIRYPKGRCTP